jgi:sec-independent protein translocase protein TatA
MHPVLGEIVGWEFLLVIAVAALLFGSSQIPKLAKSMGQASKEFRKGLEEGSADDEPAAESKADPKPPDA